MQKAYRNLRLKWALEDLIHYINGVSNIGWQRDHFKQQITRLNRDRAGGYMHTALKIKSVENMYSDEVGTSRRKSIKKSNRRLQRRNKHKIIAEALRDEEWVNEFYLYSYGTDLIDYEYPQDEYETYFDVYDYMYDGLLDLDYNEFIFGDCPIPEYEDVEPIKSFEEDEAWLRHHRSPDSNYCY